jgi:hypothetical protein
MLSKLLRGLIETGWKAATNIVHLWPVLGLETLALS